MSEGILFAPRNLSGLIAKLSPTPDGGTEVVAWDSEAWEPVNIPAGEVLAGVPASDAMLKRNGILLPSEES